MVSNNHFKYVLGLGDDSLIVAQRLSEWAYKAPFLEEDIALSNISLDLFGRANLFLEYAASLKGGKTTADDLAFNRSEREFTNLLIYEQPNGSFADTIVRQFLLDAYNQIFLEKLINSTDNNISAIAKKAIKETTYHFRHSSNWIIRLGDGTDESHEKVQNAINNLWPFTGEFFETNKIEKEMVKQKIGIDRTKLKFVWNKKINEIIDEATLSKPDDGYMKTGGREGIHTEHLGHMLSDMQYLQRAHPDAKW